MHNWYSNTTPTKPHPRLPYRPGLPRQRHRGLLLLAVGTAVVFLPTRRTQAFLFDIVFDPANLTEHVLQVAQLAEQITAAVEEVTNQIKELAHLDLPALPDIAGMASGVEGQLESGLYSTATPASQLDARYPADMGGATWIQYESDQSAWAQNQHESLIENRQLENQIYRDMDMTTQQVQSIVDASNSAPGETSAVQAHNDLLAVASGELAKLQAMRLARSRLRTEQLAQQQSERSYAEAERQRVDSVGTGGGVNPSPPTETVADPFHD